MVSAGVSADRAVKLAGVYFDTRLRGALCGIELLLKGGAEVVGLRCAHWCTQFVVARLLTRRRASSVATL